jgi:glycosyltransferase involved in cell wall biosynthesis
VFASAAWHEGFNFLPLEAMACGVPVVMTDDGGSREYARDGENAVVVPVGDADALREAIQRVLQDAELRAGLIESGMRTAWEYDWDAVTLRLADLVLKP